MRALAPVVVFRGSARRNHPQGLKPNPPDNC